MDKSLVLISKIIKNAYIRPVIGKKIAGDIVKFLASPVGKSRLATAAGDIILQEINAIISYHARDQHFKILFTGPRGPRREAFNMYRPDLIEINELEFINDTKVRQQYVGIMAKIKTPLVIDMVNCIGGSANTLYFLLCHFIKDGVNVYDRQYNNGKTHKVITGSQTGADEIIKKISGPVSILISDRTFSAGEIFAAAMQSAGRAKIYGTKSVGVTNLVDTEIVGEFSLKIPYARTIIKGYKYGPHGRDLENIGVVPDYGPETREYVNLVYHKLTDTILQNYKSGPKALKKMNT